MMTAGPWRLDALEILRVTPDAQLRPRHLVERLVRMVERRRAAARGDPDRRRPRARVGSRGRRPARASCAAAGRHRGAQPADLARGPVHDPGAVPRADRRRPRPARRRHPRGASAPSSTSRASCASRPTGRPTNPAADPGGLRRLPRRLQGRRRRAAHERGAVRGRRRRAADDPLPGEGPGVPGRRRARTCSTGSGPSASRAAACSRASSCASRSPRGDLHSDEERRLLYVAMTRAQERLAPRDARRRRGRRRASAFVAELRGRGRRGARRRGPDAAAKGDGRCRWRADGDEVDARRRRGRRRRRRRASSTPRSPPPAGSCRCPPRASAGWRCACAQPSSWACWRPPRRPIPRPTAAREAFAARLADVGRSAATARRRGAGRRARPAHLPDHRARLGRRRQPARGRAAAADVLATRRLTTYEACPLRYAFSYVYRIPEPDRPAAAPHLRLHGARGVRGVHQGAARARSPAASRRPPARTWSGMFAANWKPHGVRRQGPPRPRSSAASADLLDNFWDGEVAPGVGEALAEERTSRWSSSRTTARRPCASTASIDRIDRLPSAAASRSSTTRPASSQSQKGVDENLQLTIYALACRDALGLGTPERVTLYFTESAASGCPRSARTSSWTRPARSCWRGFGRSGRATFTATPGKACRCCDYTGDVPGAGVRGPLALAVTALREVGGGSPAAPGRRPRSGWRPRWPGCAPRSAARSSPRPRAARRSRRRGRRWR